MIDDQKDSWFSILLPLFIVIAFWVGVISAVYSAFFTDQYYFLVSEETENIEEYLVSGSAYSERECRELAEYWTNIGAKNAQCKLVPTWRHWINVSQNLLYQWGLLVYDRHG